MCDILQYTCYLWNDDVKTHISLYTVVHCWFIMCTILIIAVSGHQQVRVLCCIGTGDAHFNYFLLKDGLSPLWLIMLIIRPLPQLAAPHWLVTLRNKVIMCLHAYTSQSYGKSPELPIQREISSEQSAKETRVYSGTNCAGIEETPPDKTRCWVSPRKTPGVELQSELTLLQNPTAPNKRL